MDNGADFIAKSGGHCCSPLFRVILIRYSAFPPSPRTASRTSRGRGEVFELVALSVEEEIAGTIFVVPTPVFTDALYHVLQILGERIDALFRERLGLMVIARAMTEATALCYGFVRLFYCSSFSINYGECDHCAAADKEKCDPEEII